MTDIKDNELEPKAPVNLTEAVDTPSSPAPTDRTGDDDAGEDQPKQPRDPREEAVARYRAKRARELGTAVEDAENTGDDATQDTEAATDSDKPKASAKPSATPAADTPDADAPDADTIEIKVFGRTEKVTKDELIRRAQKASAADARLEEANRLINEYRSRLEQQTPAAATPAQPGNQPSNQPSKAETPAPAPKPAKLSDEEAARVARAIQMGDDNEARAAIQELFQKATEQAMSNVPDGRGDAATQPDIDKLFDERFQREREVTSLNNDLTTVGTEFADVMGDPRLTQVAVAEIHRLRADDLINSGLYTEQSTRQLESLARSDERYAAHLAGLHRDLELRGLATRRLDLFRQAGNAVREWYGLSAKAKANGSAEDAAAAESATEKKVAAKQALPKQPRGTAKRTQTKPEPGHGQRQQSYVRTLMKERGSLVTTRH